MALQVRKIKEKTNALSVIRFLTMDFNPYVESMLKESRVYKILKYLQESEYIRKESHGKYMLTDPLLRKYLIDI